MWESRVLCEISKRLWKSFCDFHSRVISIGASIFVSHHLLGCRKRGMLDPARDQAECEDHRSVPAVKRLMALVARRIRQIVPQSRYGKTNLQDFLTEPDS